MIATFLSLGGCGAPTPAPTPPDLPPAVAPDRSWFGGIPGTGLGSSVDLVAGLDTLPIVAFRGPEYCCEGSMVWRLEPDAASGPISEVVGDSLSPARDSWRGARFWPDLDGNGTPELAIDHSEIRLFDAARPGTPSEPGDAWATVVGALPDETCGDLDLDGAEDFCGYGAGNTVVAWFSGQGVPTFGAEDWRSPVTWRYRRGLFGLTNADGHDVLVVVAEDPDQLGQYLHTVFSPGLTDWTTSTGDASLVARGDFVPGPGTEVFLTVAGTPSVRLYALADQGLAATGAEIEVNGPDGRLWISDGAAGDFDGDGVVDLALAGLDAVWLFRGPFDPGHRVLTDADLHLPLPELVGASVAADDLDGDGRDDLLVGHPMDDTLVDDGGAVHFWWGRSLFP